MGKPIALVAALFFAAYGSAARTKRADRCDRHGQRQRRNADRRRISCPFVAERCAKCPQRRARHLRHQEPLRRHLHAARVRAGLRDDLAANGNGGCRKREARRLARARDDQLAHRDRTGALHGRRYGLDLVGADRDRSTRRRAAAAAITSVGRSFGTSFRRPRCFRSGAEATRRRCLPCADPTRPKRSSISTGIP